LWQAGSIVGLIPARVIASPASIVATAYSLVASGELIPDLLVSLARAAVGLAIGITAGAALALVAGLSRTGEDAIDPPMQMLRAVRVARAYAAPNFVVRHQRKFAKIMLIALASFFPVYITLFAGIRGVDAEADRGRARVRARSLGRDSARSSCRVRCAAALVGITAGSRHRVAESRRGRADQRGSRNRLT